jgi:hypothetical protein
LLRQALRKMGRADLIGDGERHLIPSSQPANPPVGKPGSKHEIVGDYRASRRKNTGQAHERRTGKKILTQHTGLPPREDGSKPGRVGKRPAVKR